MCSISRPNENAAAGMLPCEYREDHPALPMPAFRRTAVACQHCQGRKIRCDRRIRGSPCTNCVVCTPGNTKAQPSAGKLEKRRAINCRASNYDRDNQRVIPDHSPANPQAWLPPSTGAGPRLPDFFKTLPPHLSAEDLDYLTRKGIFQIPEAKWRYELIRSYLQFVHPLLPLLDAESFLGPMLQSNSREQISLLLFHAVMCSGAAHVDLCTLQALGYSTRRSARKAFFDRARVRTSFRRMNAADPVLAAL